MKKDHRALYLVMLSKKIQMSALDESKEDAENEALIQDIAAMAIAAGIRLGSNGDTLDEVRKSAKRSITRLMAEMDFEIKKYLKEMDSDDDTRSTGPVV
jgi:Mg/Co/Ni transporter MgtE